MLALRYTSILYIFFHLSKVLVVDPDFSWVRCALLLTEDSICKLLTSDKFNLLVSGEKEVRESLDPLD